MKKPTSKLTRMRLDLEDFDFIFENIKGKTNVTADALSRIIMTSDELQSTNVFVINTRSMTREKNEEFRRNKTQPEKNYRKKKEIQSLINSLYTQLKIRPTDQKHATAFQPQCSSSS